jgi:hypothetical protein
MGYNIMLREIYLLYDDKIRTIIIYILSKIYYSQAAK